MSHNATAISFHPGAPRWYSFAHWPSSLPLDVLGRLGYRLKYAEKPAGIGQPGALPENPAADFLGLTMAYGLIAEVDPGLPGDKAGLATGMRIIGVNGKRFSTNRLRDAIADSVTRKSVELLIEDGEDFRTIPIPYAEGLRYLQLERVANKPDLFADILKAKAK